MLTGADRIAANGDTANKIGTYGLAVQRRPSRDPVLRRRSELDRRPRDRERRRHPDRGARPGRGHVPVRSAQPRVRRDAGRAVSADRHRARRARRAIRAVAGRGGGRRVKALLLAAGYATRLRPLTDTIAKPLLPVGGRPMIDWILDRVDAADEIDEVHVVTNSRYAPAFARWAAGAEVAVHDDGTTSNETRLGAIGDIRFAIEHGGLAGRRSARDRRRQPLRVLARGVPGLLARQGRRQRARRPPARRRVARAASTASSSSTPTTGSSGSRRSPSDRAATSSRPRRTSSRRRTSRCSTGTSPRGTRPTRPGGF